MCLDKPTLHVTPVCPVSDIWHSWLSCCWKKTNLKFFWFWFLICLLICWAVTESWPLKHYSGGWRHSHGHISHGLMTFTVFFLGPIHKTWKAHSMQNKRKKLQWRLFGARNRLKRYKEPYSSGLSPYSCYLEQCLTYWCPKLPSNTWLVSRFHDIAKLKKTHMIDLEGCCLICIIKSINVSGFVSSANSCENKFWEVN